MYRSGDNGIVPLPIRFSILEGDSHVKRIALAVLVAASAALPSPAQVPSAKVDVNLVLVDATVTDRKGNQILGLGKDDFIVKEDGVTQVVDSIDYFTNRRLIDSRESEAKFKVERVKEERYFILFFQKSPDPLFNGEALAAKRAAQEWVKKELLATDRVAVVGFDARLKIFTDFTSDKQRIRKALDQSVQYGKGITAPPADPARDSIVERLNGDRLIRDTGTIYSAIEELSDATRRIVARKVLILFSPGIGEVTSERIPIGRPDEVRYQPMIEALNRSNVSVHPIFLLRNYRHQPVEDVLGRMASETGGEYHTNVVNFSLPLKNIEKQNNGYYLLSYKPVLTASRRKGFHKLDVSLRNPEFRVKARQAYAD